MTIKITMKNLRALVIALCIVLLGAGIIGSMVYAREKETSQEFSFSSEEIALKSASWKEEAGMLLYTKEYLLGENEDPSSPEQRLKRTASAGAFISRKQSRR